MYNSSHLKPVGKCRYQLTISQNSKKYKLKLIIVKDNNASINLNQSRAAQQMNLIQGNHENLLSDTNEAVNVVQTRARLAWRGKKYVPNTPMCSKA